jgi:hypothetical protein
MFIFTDNSYIDANMMINTSDGIYKIIDLYGKNILVWNGSSFESTIVIYNGLANLYKITLSNGQFIYCSALHEWLIENKIILTKNLSCRMKIKLFKLPLLTLLDPDIFLNPYIHGMISSILDKLDTFDYEHIRIPKSKKELLSIFNPTIYCENTQKYFFYYKNCQNKSNKDELFIPLNYSIKTKLEWISGIIDRMGSLRNYFLKKEYFILIKSNRKDSYNYLLNIQLVLETLGVYSKVISNSELKINMHCIYLLYKLGLKLRYINLNKIFIDGNFNISSQSKLYIKKIEKNIKSAHIYSITHFKSSRM